MLVAHVALRLLILRYALRVAPTFGPRYVPALVTLTLHTLRLDYVIAQLRVRVDFALRVRLVTFYRAFVSWITHPGYYRDLRAHSTVTFAVYAFSLRTRWLDCYVC